MESQVSCTGVLQLLIQFLLLSVALGDETLSCKTKGVFLSLNRTLAPLNMIRSSGASSGYPATYIYNFGYEDDTFFKTWCTLDFLAPDPFIEMELTSPVLITQILFSGRSDRSGSYYVTNLTLEYSPPDNATVLSYYTTETESIKYFAALHLNTLIPLEQPLLTKRIRLRPVEWFDYDSISKSFEYICLGVGLYGCLAKEAIVTTSGTAEEDQLPSSQAPTANMDSTSGKSETAAQSVTKVVRDNQALAIVLPIALLTIIINALIVGVGVYICVFLRGRKENSEVEKSQGYASGNLEWSSKSLERTNSAPPVHVNTQSGRSDRAESVVKKVENPIYGSSPLSQSDTVIGPHIFTSASETGYEPVNHNIHTINEDEEGDLVDNLAYGKVDSENEVTGHQLQCETINEDEEGDLVDNLAYGKVDGENEITECQLQCETINEDEEGDLIDNLAYGKVDGENEVTGHQFQYESVVALKGNESYGSVPSLVAQDQDEGELEYSYPTISTRYHITSTDGLITPGQANI